MNLTKTAIMFKRWVKIGLLIFGVYYGWMFFGGPGVRSLVKIFYATKEPPNPIYGNLDPLEFTNVGVTGEQTYRLNTKNGRLPREFPYKMDVYKFKDSGYSLLAGDNAMKDAAFFGYTTDDLITDLKGTVYQWRKADTNSYLEVDINSRRLYADSDMVKNSARMASGKLNDETVSSSAYNFFTKLERMDQTYQDGTYRITYGYVGGTKLYPTTASRDREFARVDLYRKIGDFSVLGPDPMEGMLNVTVAVPINSKSLIISYPKAEAYYKEIEPKTTASYPIIDISTAWDAVKEGKGVITSVTPADTSIFDKKTQQTISEILVDNIYLAYYENTAPQKYLQPIYVFEAKYKSLGSQGGSMVIYLPAVSGEYVNPVQTPQPAPAQ